jgi:PDZ domain
MGAHPVPPQLRSAIQSAGICILTSLILLGGGITHSYAKNKTSKSSSVHGESSEKSGNQQNPFDGKWVGTLDCGGTGNLSVTITIYNGGTSVKWSSEAQSGFGGSVTSEQHGLSTKVEGTTAKWGTPNRGDGVWTLTPASNGNTAVVTFIARGLLFGGVNASGTFQRVSPPSSTSSSSIVNTTNKSNKAAKAEVSGEEIATKSSSRKSKGYSESNASLESSYGIALDKAEAMLEGKSDAPQNKPPTGIYAIEKDYTFNVLDSVYYDPSKEQLSLIGHFDNRFSKRKIPYVQHLATLLENSEPEFSLSWTPDSEKRLEGLFARRISQAESDSITETWGNLYDKEGNLTKAGRYMLPALGVSPISGNRLPGSMGVEVVAEPKTLFVRISKVIPGSGAATAGLQVGDIITVTNGRPPFSPEEFDHYIRLCGTGSGIPVTYMRNSQRRGTVVPLDASDDHNVWRGATDSMSLLQALYFAAGNSKAGQLVEMLGARERAKEKYHAPEEVINDMNHTIWYILGLLQDANSVNEAIKSGRDSQALRLDFIAKFLRAQEETLGFHGAPATDAFTQARRRGDGGAASIAVGMAEFNRQMELKTKALLNPIFERPEGLQIPPELVEDRFHIHPEMVPQYLGVDKHSLLARAMFSSDYLCKRLLQRPELKLRITEYQTGFEFEVKHPEFRHTTGNYRIWISIDKMDTPQSASGKTLAFQDVKMKFNIRDESGRASDASGKDLPNKPGGYEELLTSLWDNLEQEYPTLHELRESAKIADAAEWILTKNPSASLPKEGRVPWQGPAKVPGLVYFEMTPDSSRATKTKVTIIANGGDSFKRHHPESGVLTPFPINSAVLDAPVVDANQQEKEGTNTNAQQLMTIYFHSTKAAIAASDEEASDEARKGFDTSGGKSQGKIDTSSIKTPTSEDMRIPPLPKKYWDDQKIMAYDKDARDWLSKSDKLEVEVEQLEQKRKTANDGGKTEVELANKLNEKIAADSHWHAAKINRDEAISLTEGKIEK